MELSARQKQIVDIVKKEQPVSGEKISELMEISRATLRSDLSFLKAEDIMVSPVLVSQDTFIQDAVIRLFMYDADVLYVIDEKKLLLGIVSRKDLLRAALSSSIGTTPIAVCMTRMPHLRTCHKDMNILEVAALLQDFAIDSLPVVEKDNERKILGTVTKTALLDYIIQEARQAEVKRQE